MADKMFEPNPAFREKAWVKSKDEYMKMYKSSLDDPEGFWGEMASQFHWYKKWDKVMDYNFDMSKGRVKIEWFRGGKTNISYNCLDRHLAKRGDQVALIWEGNQPGTDRKLTYRELHEQVCKFANVLKAHGVKKGDRVSLYMQMIPELAVSMLACARIGAIHSIVFGAFSPDSLSDRIVDSTCKLVVTQDTGLRGPKQDVPMKTNADKAAEKAAGEGTKVEKIIVVKRTGEQVPMQAGRDSWWDDEMAKVDAKCEPEVMDAEDPLFILYTSGSTGKPKGVLHTVGGYMVYTAVSHKYIFDYHDGDVFWCTADIGWVTGHSYIVYGPLQNGAISVMFEGVPTYPEPDRFWAVVDKHKVTQFYTAPTAIRALMAQGEKWPAKHSLASLKLLGSVGEPINPEAWLWYNKNVGHEKCPIVDTWWQTETGGILITPLPGAWGTKPGSATLPFFGVDPVVLDDQGKELTGACSGILAIRRPWPGLMRTVYGDHERFEKTYFEMFKGLYFTGDGCRRDEDGYYWITGRVDDVINVSGHRLGTAEVESALVSHPKVAEAAVVGYPHEIKGQGIYAYVTLNVGEEYSDALKKELVAHVRKEIGAHAAPDQIHWAPGLPKTRSGKIMRRILRKIAECELGSIGDTSTLADPSVVEDLIKNDPRKK
ncbi:MAG: acetate--CoA ligase [Proteobacteria bacterium]|jgi:acetyl-CoA synthetase|nr:acetate--CoA ligase [Pseudomonadota bacterium]